MGNSNREMDILRKNQKRMLGKKTNTHTQKEK